MNRISRSDIRDGREYEQMRPEMRRRIILLKGRRRVPVGGHAMFHFENRETMIYQIHEMLRAEKSWERPGAVEDEIEAYQPLVPDGRSLSATLMFEYDSPEERDRRLRELVGIEKHVWLQVGDTERLLAEFDRAQADDGRISSVQYLKWTLDDDRARLVRTDGTVLRIVMDHPAYRAGAVLSEETRRDLAGDLD